MQGVGFRCFTKQHAIKQGVIGWVRNLPDGRVDIWAQAEENILEDFCDLLRQGAPGSSIEKFETERLTTNPVLSDFKIRL